MGGTDGYDINLGGRLDNKHDIAKMPVSRTAKSREVDMIHCTVVLHLETLSDPLRDFQQKV